MDKDLLIAFLIRELKYVKDECETYRKFFEERIAEIMPSIEELDKMAEAFMQSKDYQDWLSQPAWEDSFYLNKFDELYAKWREKRQS